MRAGRAEGATRWESLGTPPVLIQHPPALRDAFPQRSRDRRPHPLAGPSCTFPVGGLRPLFPCLTAAEPPPPPVISPLACGEDAIRGIDRIPVPLGGRERKREREPADEGARPCPKSFLASMPAITEEPVLRPPCVEVLSTCGPGIGPLQIRRTFLSSAHVHVQVQVQADAGSHHRRQARTLVTVSLVWCRNTSRWHQRPPTRADV